MPFCAVLFDIDGTLVDSNEQHVDAWAVAFRAAGHPQELDAIRMQIGKGGDLLVPTLLPDASKEEQKAIADAHGAHFKSAYLDHVRPFPGAHDLLAKTKARGFKVALASSAKREELDHYAALLAAKPLIAATTSIDDVGTSKPAPDIFGCAIEKLGVDAADALAIGDTPYDVEAARGAGIATIGLTSGPFSERQMRDAGAIAIFADVADLLRNFERSPLASG